MQATSNVEIDRKALFVPAVAPLYETLAPFGYALIRAALGLILVPHGFAKLFLNDAVPTSRHFVDWGWAYPLAWAYLIGAIEFFGGLLALGLFTREMAIISRSVNLGIDDRHREAPQLPSEFGIATGRDWRV